MKIIESQEEFDKLVVNGVFKIKDNVRLEFNLATACNIDACNIDAYNIDAGDIDACNIKAYDINAYDINACNIDAYNIDACNIDAYNIDADNIDAGDIDACDIKACNIKYYAFCIARKSINCKSCQGKRVKCLPPTALDGEVIIGEIK